MKVYEFGSYEKPSLLLLPGTCCHWKTNFGKVLPLLVTDFYVICISYDGFDETEDSIFPTMSEECTKMEDYIIENLNGRVHSAYGCSLGGSFVGLLVQRKRIHIEHAILGSSDLDQDKALPAMLKGKIVAGVMNNMIRKGRLPRLIQKQLDNNTAEDMVYYKKLIDSFGVDDPKMKFIKKRSIYNQFYSDLVTPLEDDISVPGTKVHIFYALKMGKKYEKRYLQHFKNPEILRQEFQHEELLFCYPEQWAKVVREVSQIPT